MTVKFTKHAQSKIKQRGISIDKIKMIIEHSETREKDKFDQTITHFIGKIGARYLRVIGRVMDNTVLVISAFYDRRLKRRKL